MNIDYQQLNEKFSGDAREFKNEFNTRVHARGTFLNLVEKRMLPERQGFHFQKEVPALGTNDCTVLNFNACVALIRSDQVCFEDMRTGYLFECKVRNEKLNLMDNALQELESRVLHQYTEFCPKIESLYLFKTLDELYPRLVENGAFGHPELFRETGEPVFLCITSSEAIKKAQENPNKLAFGKGKIANEWLSQRLARTTGESDADVLVVNGFAFIAEDTLPRYSSDGDELPKWNTKQLSDGPIAVLSEDYQNAPVGTAVVWNSASVDLLLAKDRLEDFGVAWSWQNIPNSDEKSPDYNPLGSMGRFYCQMTNAVRPGIIQFGATIKYPR